jgi:Ppx/GppA phosphatase family
MLCCLNPACQNPPVDDSTKYCPDCGVPLLILRNRYRPVKSLGGGGFAKTYLAEDIDKLNEKCIIKQFAPQVQDGQQHPNQKPQGLHEPYDNYGNDCVICNLKREQVVGDASKSPFKAIAISLLAGILAASGVGCRAVVSSSSPNPSASASPSKETGSQCSTDKLVKKSGNLFGAIEVGSKGVKGKVIQELPTLNKDGAKLIFFRKEKIEDRNVNAADLNTKSATIVEAVKSTFEDIQKRFNISCEQIVIYGSSGLEEKLAKDPQKKEVIVQEVRQATGRTMRFITSEEEGIFVFDGVVPAWRLNETIVVDIGSGNTKGAYLDSNNKHITFSLPGTETFTKKVKESQGNIDFKVAAENVKQKELVPQIASEVQRKPGMQNLPRVYLGGGISWALFTLTKPCSKEYTVTEGGKNRLDSFVPISSEDIKTFYDNATQDQKTLFNPDLSNCSAERRKEVQKDIADIKTKIFKGDSIIAGAEILRAFNQELNFSGKQVFFARSAKDALPIGYLQQQLKKVEEDADQ